MTSVYGVTFVGARAQVGGQAHVPGSAGLAGHAHARLPDVPYALRCVRARLGTDVAPGLPAGCTSLASGLALPAPNPAPRPAAPRSQIGNRLKERGFEDNQFMYKVSCYSAKVGWRRWRWEDKSWRWCTTLGRRACCCAGRAG